MPEMPSQSVTPAPGTADALDVVPALGATVHDGGVAFAVWTGTGERVEVCLFDEDRREERFVLPAVVDGVHHGFVPGVGPGARYGFRVHGRWDPARGERYNPVKLLLDQYARAIDGRLDHDGPVTGHVAPAPLAGTGDTADADLVRDDRDSAPWVPLSVVVDAAHADGYDWCGDVAPRTRWVDTVIYEAHVRGLTARHPSVPERERGTFAGLGHPDVVAHLVSLGVTAVELLPVHHFVTEATVAARGLPNYWGYSSVGFFAPHAAYSAAGSRGEQVAEFKDMVRALHGAGLEVILDVVYNHTAEGDEDGPTIGLRGQDNRASYRLRKDGRRYDDVTGTGNTLDLAQPHTLGLVLDSLRYWVQEMHVDGFRFDLAPALARTPHGVDMRSSFMTSIARDPVIRAAKLIAEPWDVGPGGYRLGGFPPPWTEWNDRFRDTVRDFWRGSSHGVRDLGYRLSGSSDLFRDGDRRPYASINFVTAHDGFTLRDLVSYDSKHNEANLEDGADGAEHNRSWNCGAEGETNDATVAALRRRQMRNLVGTLLLSTGVPMLVAGDEIGRTQLGNNNAYCQDNAISWVDWAQAASWGDMCSFVQRLTQLRRRHATLRQRHFFDGRPVRAGGPKDLTWLTANGDEMTDADWHDPHLQTLGLYLSGDALRQHDPAAQRVADDSFLLWLHAGEDDVRVQLPDVRQVDDAPSRRSDATASATGTSSPDLAGSGDYVLEVDTARDGGVAVPSPTFAAGSAVSIEARSLVLLRIPAGPRTTA
jgi:glycogen operon protein